MLIPAAQTAAIVFSAATLGAAQQLAHTPNLSLESLGAEIIEQAPALGVLALVVFLFLRHMAASEDRAAAAIANLRVTMAETATRIERSAEKTAERFERAADRIGRRNDDG